MCALVSLSSCEHHEPVNPIKPVDERTVLVLTYNGEVFDQYGDLVSKLPNCLYAAEIISDGEDFFASGTHAKGRVGYWKNGKWNTLHVDFIDDVDHWVYGIGKWDYYFYLLDVPNVLKNSGIFPLENFHDFVPPRHALAVSEGKCYVIGYGFGDDENADGQKESWEEHNFSELVAAACYTLINKLIGLTGRQFGETFPKKIIIQIVAVIKHEVHLQETFLHLL